MTLAAGYMSSLEGLLVPSIDVRSANQQPAISQGGPGTSIKDFPCDLDIFITAVIHSSSRFTGRHMNASR